MERDEYRLMAEVEDEHWWWRARREILSKTIDRYLAPGAGGPRAVLELGCGTGGNLPMLERYGAVTGAESESAAIDFLRRKHGDRFVVIQHAIPDPLPRVYDVICMFDVLEHIEDDEGALRWVARHLAPGAIAILTAPAFPFLWTEHDEAAHHYRRYTPGALRRIVPAELEVVHLTCFNTILFPPVAAVRLGTKLLPGRYRPQGTNMKMPPRFLNWLLYRIFRTDRHLAHRARAALGVSVLAVLRRRDG